MVCLELGLNFQIALKGNKLANKCLSYSNETRTNNHLVHKRTLNHLAKSA